jgi:CHAT domain-containing protein
MAAWCRRAIFPVAAQPQLGDEAVEQEVGDDRRLRRLLVGALVDGAEDRRHPPRDDVAELEPARAGDDLVAELDQRRLAHADGGGEPLLGRDLVNMLRPRFDGGAGQHVGAPVRRLGDARRADLGVAAARAQAGATALPFDLDAAHALYQGLFAPLERLSANKHLLIVPMGALAQLPFQVLVSEPPGAVSARDAYRSAAWLGRRQPVTVMPAVSSLKALREQARASQAKRPFIGFADPLLDGPDASYAEAARAARAAVACPPEAKAPARRVASASKGAASFSSVFRGAQADVKQVRALPPLPETTDEVCAVARSIGAPASDLWLGARASEGNVKRLSQEGRLADYRVVHFATHGLIAGGPDALQRSLAEPAIVLTPPADETGAADLATDDGLLTAAEVAALKMDADWVVLSACNTAAGGARGAEAFSGLARAFFYAGARALLVSHWEVDSVAAVELVTKAFAELEADPTLGRAEAMRRAMATAIDRGGLRAHPAYWAPLVVVGEGGAAAAQTP